MTITLGFFALFITSCINLKNNDTASVQLKNCVIQQVIPGAKVTAAFFSIEKQGADVSILSARIPSITQSAELHEMTMKDGNMRMNKIDSYPLKNGSNFFQKGSYHVMLTDMKKSFNVGENHEMTLTFDNGQTASCNALVKRVESISSNNNSQ